MRQMAKFHGQFVDFSHLLMPPPIVLKRQTVTLPCTRRLDFSSSGHDHDFKIFLGAAAAVAVDRISGLRRRSRAQEPARRARRPPALFPVRGYAGFVFF